MKFFIAFGVDGTCGDTQYHPIPLPCPTKPTFEKLAKASKDHAIKERIYSEEEFDEYHEDLAGFWIIDERTKTAIEKADDCGNIGSDSALYRHIKTLKVMAEAMAIETITKP